ncbi:hypothetical protein FZC66_10780 [Priestia megaterium]|nr:hypothetical protein FZC66_10780 [Priestia megaterium]
MLKPDVAIILGLLVEEAYTRLDEQVIKQIAITELENGYYVFQEAKNIYEFYFLSLNEQTKRAIQEEVFSLHLTLNQIKNSYASGLTPKILHIHQIIAETEKSTNIMNQLFGFPLYEGDEDQTYTSFMNIFANKQ